MKFKKKIIRSITKKLKEAFWISFFFLMLSVFWSIPFTTNFLPVLQNEPLQQQTTKEVFKYQKNDTSYVAYPKYEYEIWGVVVSQNKIGKWWNVKNSREKDLCIVWGDNLSKDLNAVDFSSGNYTCYWKNSDAATIQNTSISNNHLVTDDTLVRHAIANTNIGDQIRMKGYLIAYEDATTGRLKRDTSVVRTDTGNGACETIFVEEFEILKTYWPLSRLFFATNKILFLLLLIANIYWAFNGRFLLLKRSVKPLTSLIFQK